MGAAGAAVEGRGRRAGWWGGEFVADGGRGTHGLGLFVERWEAGFEFDFEFFLVLFDCSLALNFSRGDEVDCWDAVLACESVEPEVVGFVSVGCFFLRGS